MGTDLSEWAAHPLGEQPEVEEWSTVADTFAGRVHIESDTATPVTPLGQGNDLVLLRWPLCVGFRFRVRQGLDGRPQLIDQPLAVADFSTLFDTWKSIPQCQQPLATERRGVQFVVRRDGNLAVIDCGWQLAAQRDSVIADDVDAHGSVLPIGPGSGCRR